MACQTADDDIHPNLICIGIGGTQKSSARPLSYAMSLRQYEDSREKYTHLNEDGSDITDNEIPRSTLRSDERIAMEHAVDNEAVIENVVERKEGCGG